MNWATFYLICFVVGLIFSLLSLLGGLGRFHFGGHLHLPHFLGHQAGPVHVPPVHLHTGGGQLGALQRGVSAGRGSQVSFFNFSSFMAFLACVWRNGLSADALFGPVDGRGFWGRADQRHGGSRRSVFVSR